MQTSRKVSVERNRLRFAAAHMATFHGDCEPLHGHNYDVIVELEGDLTEESWVWDFGALKQAARALAEQLDHKFLLQRESKLLEIQEGTDSWKVRFGDRGYVLPKRDVIALPMDNTTTERLAEWFAAGILRYLDENGGGNVRKVTIGVEEMPGQTGWYTVER